MRLGLIGSGGSGKTTLAREVSKEFALPFETLSTASVMSSFNFITHTDVLNAACNDSARGIAFQRAIVEQRAIYFSELYEENKDFVTDRTPLDSFFYYVIQNSFWDRSDTGHILETIALDSLHYYDYVIHIESGAFPISAESIGRPTNKFYHEMFDSLVRSYYDGIRERTNLIEIPRTCKSIQDRMSLLMSNIDFEVTQNAD
jgi:hypothetical protein